MRFDVVGLTSGMKSVLITAMFNIGTIPVVAPKGTAGGSGVIGVDAVSKLGSNEDVANIFTTAIRFLKTFLQRSDEYNTLECL